MAALTSKMESKVVPQADWLAARKDLLRKEKEFTRLRDELSRQRRELPWETVEKRYAFDGTQGTETLRRPLRREKSADRLPLHVWAGMERGLPQLLIPGRYLQRRLDPSSGTRHDVCCDLTGAPAGDRTVQETHGMAVQVGVLVRERLQL